VLKHKPSIPCKIHGVVLEEDGCGVPGTAGFFFAAPDALGAIVFAILLISFATCNPHGT
jgi:hypothetical protein